MRVNKSLKISEGAQYYRRIATHTRRSNIQTIHNDQNGLRLLEGSEAEKANSSPYSKNAHEKKVVLLPFNWVSATPNGTLSSKYILPLLQLPELPDKKELLDFIDKEVWQKGILFSANESEDFYNEYLNHLEDLLNVTAKTYNDYFSLFKARDKGSSIVNFAEIVQILKRQDKLTKQQRAIYLTQAIELALMGVNITPVLTKINQECKANKHVPKGFRQELLANWFLTKFVHKSEIDVNYTNQIIPSIIIETKAKNGKASENEIDSLIQIHPYSLVSVKHNCVDSFPSKIKALACSIACNETIRNKAKKMIIVSGSGDENQWRRNYFLDAKYSSKKHESITLAKNLIDFKKFTNEEEKCIKTLLHEERIDIYHVPFVENENDLGKWIQLMYKDYL